MELKLLVNVENLQKGIMVFKSNTNWDRDFHDSTYRRLAQNKNFDVYYWRKIVDYLISWMAYRGRTRDFIESRGLKVLPQVRDQYYKIIKRFNGREPELFEVKWTELSTLFQIAWDIKDVSSPVFASKMCHFILPSCFPVIDNPLMQKLKCGDYKTYWKACHEGWMGCTCRKEVIDLLREEIRGPVFESYPWSSKITELCCWGDGTSPEYILPTTLHSRPVIGDFYHGIIEVGDILISHKGNYHYVVTSINGGMANLLWIERSVGEPIGFYFYPYATNIDRALIFYDHIKKDNVDRRNYRTPRGGWPV